MDRGLDTFLTSRQTLVFANSDHDFGRITTLIFYLHITDETHGVNDWGEMLLLV